MKRAALMALCIALIGGLWLGQRSLPQQSSAAAVQPAALATIPQASGPRLLLSQGEARSLTADAGFLKPPVSLLRVDRRLAYGDYVWNDENVPDGPTWIRVDLRTQLLSVFRGGHEIGTAVVLYGADSKETPLGRFPILWKGRDHRSSLYDAPMPFTLRLTGDGIAIHGSDVRWGAATHGCVGIPTSFARRLFEVVSVRDPVVIVRTPAPQA